MADKPCGGCGVLPGQRHNEGCDVARCRATGFQLAQCEGELHEHNGRKYGVHAGACGPDTWTGTWPGEAECREFGWFTYFVPNGRPSWRQCSSDHPEGSPDLNRLVQEAHAGKLRWDSEQEKWLALS